MVELFAVNAEIYSIFQNVDVFSHLTPSNKYVKIEVCSSQHHIFKMRYVL
jgi:hypothetical protein